MTTVVNESSILMQARWDWADKSAAGKWGTAWQVHRKLRAFIPSQDEFEDRPLGDGTPVIVTKNRVRGRGRSLHLMFDTERGKDAHLLGWTINYTVETDV